MCKLRLGFVIKFCEHFGDLIHGSENEVEKLYSLNLIVETEMRFYFLYFMNSVLV